MSTSKDSLTEFIGVARNKEGLIIGAELSYKRENGETYTRKTPTYFLESLLNTSKAVFSIAARHIDEKSDLTEERRIALKQSPDFQSIQRAKNVYEKAYNEVMKLTNESPS